MRHGFGGSGGDDDDNYNVYITCVLGVILNALSVLTHL